MGCGAQQQKRQSFDTSVDAINRILPYKETEPPEHSKQYLDSRSACTKEQVDVSWANSAGSTFQGYQANHIASELEVAISASPSHLIAQEDTVSGGLMSDCTVSNHLPALVADIVHQWPAQTTTVAGLTFHHPGHDALHWFVDDSRL